MDVIELIGKDSYKEIRENGPMLHPYLKEMNENTFAGKGLMTVGETWNSTPKSLQNIQIQLVMNYQWYFNLKIKV